MRVLLVEDEPAVRELLRVTLESAEVRIEEAGTAEQAEEQVVRWSPDVIVLDLGLPGRGGEELCRRLKAQEQTRAIPIVVLTGADPEVAERARQAGAEALLRKPFSPLELLAVLERLTGLGIGLLREPRAPSSSAQEEVLLYARDLRHLLELERGQRALLQESYLATVSALAGALEQKDSGTGAHSLRVQRYALELLRLVDPDLAEREQRIGYGFLLHDIGKIAIPDRILLKPGPLTPRETTEMQQHTILGEQMLSGVTLLEGEPLRVVRSHHERWDGSGYPDKLAGKEIPLVARVFAVADTLDAITSNRSYRSGASWERAHAKITAQAGRQFDPNVVQAFIKHENALRQIRRSLAA
jgi:ribonuclease P protein subunit RPR2